MSVVTKKGDSGQTGLLGGERIPKDDVRLQAIGTVDELNSALGVLRSYELGAEIDEELKLIQSGCFTIGSQLAANEPAAPLPPRSQLNEITAQLEERIVVWESGLPPQHKFILPTGVPAAAAAFWVRAIARRAERAVVAAERVYPLPSETLKFFNRLSDYLFILGRFQNQQAGMAETEWSGRL